MPVSPPLIISEWVSTECGKIIVIPISAKEKSVLLGPRGGKLRDVRQEPDEIITMGVVSRRGMTTHARQPSSGARQIDAASTALPGDVAQG